MKIWKSTLLLFWLALMPACALVKAEENGADAPGRADAPSRADAPPANLFAALELRGIRSSMQAKDLTSAWRVTRIAGSPEQNALWQMMTHQRNPNATPWDALYYTRGDVMTLSGTAYLIAYRALAPADPAERQRQQQFLMAWLQQQNEGDASNLNLLFNPEAPPLDAETFLALSLLPLSQGISLHDIKAFDPEKDLLTDEMKSRQKVKIERRISQSNLKQAALGMMQYMQDYDEKIPPMRAARKVEEMTNWNAPQATVQAVLQPYVKSTQIFVHPGTQRPYLPNYKISRRSLAEFGSPHETIMFFEDAPDAEGKRNIAFLDGHVKAFDEAEFQKMRKAQGISDSGLPPPLSPKRKPDAKPQSKSPPAGAPPE